MILSLMTYRTPSQRAVTVVKAFTVEGGTKELCHITWDPRGPMTAVEACLEGMERAAASLRGRAAAAAPTKPRDDEGTPRRGLEVS